MLKSSRCSARETRTSEWPEEFFRKTCGAFADHPVERGGGDLMIAAIALASGSILVTHNTREFGRIDDLKHEDWE